MRMQSRKKRAAKGYILSSEQKNQNEYEKAKRTAIRAEMTTFPINRKISIKNKLTAKQPKNAFAVCKGTRAPLFQPNNFQT